MPADPIHPDQLDGEQRFRADLVAYLDSLPIGELAELLGGATSQPPGTAGAGCAHDRAERAAARHLQIAAAAGHPVPGEGRRRSLRDVVADRRAARTSRHPDSPASGFAEWLADRQQEADLHAERARAGAVGERRVAEALRARASDPDPERDRQEQEQERDRKPEDDFSDSWNTYRERADRIRRTYGWTVPQPPPRAEPWLPLGRDDHQERDSDREDR